MVRAHDVTVADHRSHDDWRSFFGRFRRHSAAGGRAKGFASPSRSLDAADVPAVRDLDNATFLDALDGGVTIVDFWAPWCGPCRQLHPLFDAQASAHADATLRFARVNIDENPGVAAACNIMSIPTIITFNADGHEIERQIGLPGRRRLEQMVRSGASVAQAAERLRVAIGRHSLRQGLE
jgi:thioredoxin